MTRLSNCYYSHQSAFLAWDQIACLRGENRNNLWTKRINQLLVIARNSNKALFAVLMLFLLLFPMPRALSENQESLPGEQYVQQDGNTLSLQELAKGYISKMMRPASREMLRGPLMLGSRLTGKEARLYQALYQSVSEVAAGERESTTFEIPASSVLEKLTYTAEDLGIASIASEGRLTSEAILAVKAAVAADIQQVIKALLYDCPYELYWYDKTIGYWYWNPSYSWNSANITIKGCYKVSMTVAQEYAGAEDYTYNTDYGQAVLQAAAAAQAIIQENSGLSDIQTLRAYKDAVCSLADYNKDVWANGESQAAYGNPWQLVWVFDQDPETKVVCEGYAKAFQFLCDNTDFQSDLTVLTVTGTLTYASSTERHMWNIVRMYNGLNYLTDITNCDEKTIGYPDKLFLAGYVSGNPQEGYWYQPNGHRVLYRYEENYGGFITNEDLALSGEAYELSARFEYEIEDGEIRIDQYTGASDSVTIPDQYEGCAITKIGPRAFADNESLTSVTLSNHIVDIGSEAFAGCANLQTVAIPDSVRYIGDHAFQNDICLTDIDLPDGIISIGQDAFLNCSRILLHVSLDTPGLAYALSAKTPYIVTGSMFEPDFLLPSSLRVIRPGAFQGISARYIQLSDQAVSIGSRAFADNPALVKIYIPPTVVSIDPTAFDGAESLIIYGAGEESKAKEFAMKKGYAFVTVIDSDSK